MPKLSESAMGVSHADGEASCFNKDYCSQFLLLYYQGEELRVSLIFFFPGPGSLAKSVPDPLSHLIDGG
jgi:hypothetical protein